MDDNRSECDEEKGGVTGACRLRSGENFINDRKEFIFNSFIYFKPVNKFENRGACENLCVDNSTSKRSLNMTSYLLL